MLVASGRARALLAAERTALNFLGHLSGVATLTARFVEAVAGTGAQHPRHPQDDPGPARAGEGRGRRRRRPQPPHRPLRRLPDQGEPHRPRRQPRQGGLRGPQGPPRAAGRGRGPQPRRDRLRARHRRRPAAARQHGPETMRAAVELRDENAAERRAADPRGLRRRRPRDRARRSPRPASTSSRSAPSPTRPRPSTSPSCSAPTDAHLFSAISRANGEGGQIRALASRACRAEPRSDRLVRRSASEAPPWRDLRAAGSSPLSEPEERRSPDSRAPSWHSPAPTSSRCSALLHGAAARSRRRLTLCRLLPADPVLGRRPPRERWRQRPIAADFSATEVANYVTGPVHPRADLWRVHLRTIRLAVDVDRDHHAPGRRSRSGP